jgi:hypothetical protein
MLKKYLTILITFFFILCNSAFCSELASAIISAYDTYIPPEGADTPSDNIKSITLQAKLEQKGVLDFNPDAKGEILTFYVDGIFFDKAKTDKNGFAKVTFQPKERKNHYLTVRLEGSKIYKADEDTGLIYAINPKKPTIIVDIDDTISKTNKTSVVFNSFDKSKPLKDSSEVLTFLEKYYNIIFVTGREDGLLHKTRSWLKAWKFPLLPVFYADIGQTPVFIQSKYKKRAVAKIKKDIKNTIAGVGDRSYDAKAYLKNGLKALLIRKNPEDDVPEGAVKVHNWLEIKEELIKENYIKTK